MPIQVSIPLFMNDDTGDFAVGRPKPGFVALTKTNSGPLLASRGDANITVELFAFESEAAAAVYAVQSLSLEGLDAYSGTLPCGAPAVVKVNSLGLEEAGRFMVFDRRYKVDPEVPYEYVASFMTSCDAFDAISHAQAREAHQQLLAERLIQEAKGLSGKPLRALQQGLEHIPSGSVSISSSSIEDVLSRANTSVADIDDATIVALHEQLQSLSQGSFATSIKGVADLAIDAIADEFIEALAESAGVKPS
jgi:hypothetical protein